MGIRKDVVKWAGVYADILKKHGPHAEGGVSPTACLAMSIKGQDNPQLVAALNDILAKSKKLLLPDFDAFAAHPDVFDKRFMTVFMYGYVYMELHIVLDRYANFPEEMFLPYYEKDTFPPDKDYRWNQGKNTPESWDERNVSLAEHRQRTKQG